MVRESEELEAVKLDYLSASSRMIILWWPFGRVTFF